MIKYRPRHWSSQYPTWLLLCKLRLACPHLRRFSAIMPRKKQLTVQYQRKKSGKQRSHLAAIRKKRWSRESERSRSTPRPSESTRAVSPQRSTTTRESQIRPESPQPSTSSGIRSPREHTEEPRTKIPRTDDSDTDGSEVGDDSEDDDFQSGALHRSAQPRSSDLPTTIVDLHEVNNLVQNCLCPNCGNSGIRLRSDERRRKGLAVPVTLSCHVCDFRQGVGWKWVCSSQLRPVCNT